MRTTPHLRFENFSQLIIIFHFSLSVLRYRMIPDLVFL
ncbi:hypothetical protein FHS57_005075 [Runella defluvii]|uniref:Uncharacterized protein n=1 Tax=Runella defluvii TaxID=370973 RepID=A0A7W5ZST2_9BACT|nr:hypothetical protein [Runella defluvii]